LNAIILAAGKGERLRPLTDNRPKCLVKLFGKSILEWQIESFQNLGITDITVVTGYLSDLINFPSVKIIKIINLILQICLKLFFVQKQVLQILQ